MKVQNKFPVLLLCLIVIGLMVGCGSAQTPRSDSATTEGFGVKKETPSEEEENINVAFALDIVVAWTVASSDLTPLPENPVLVTMADRVMTVETECYMFSGRYTATPRLSISDLSEISSRCENISAEEQALVDTLPKAHSFYFRDDSSVELAYGDGLVIVLEEQQSYATSSESKIQRSPTAVRTGVSD